MKQKIELVLAGLIVLGIFYVTPLKYWVFIILTGACLRGLIYIFTQGRRQNNGNQKRKSSTDD